ncbi:MAG: hypothetical protein ABIH01_03555 [Candidatus Omnitrophota bacterium]
MVVTDSASRRNKVLKLIIDTYIGTATPVSSDYICQKCALGLSPATIRNIMADLEKMGYLYHPHTSAGRVPTDSGYRFYVDELMQPQELNTHEQAAIKTEFDNTLRYVESLNEALSRILALMSGQLAVSFSEGKLRFIGVTNILGQPEFSDVNCCKSLLRALEDEEEFVDILSEDLLRENVCIHIGTENKYRELHHCSIVVSPYKTKNKSAGTVAVVGPTRLAYAKLVKRIEYLSNLAEKILL